MKITHQIFIDILHFNEVTVDVVEVAAARESLVIGSVWGMARERMQDNDEEKLQNTGEYDKNRRPPQPCDFACNLPRYLAAFLPRYLALPESRQ